MRSPEEPFEAPLVLRQINRWLLGLALALALAGLWELCASAERGAVEAGGTLGWITFSLVVLGLTVHTRPAPRAVARNVRIDAEAVQIGSHAIPRATLRGAEIVPARDGSLFVRVARRRRLALDLGVNDRQEGRRVLRALGFDASRSVARFTSRSYATGQSGLHRWLALIGVPLLFGITATLASSTPWMLGVGFKVGVLLVAGWVIATAIPARIDVGADGILVRWLGTRKFIPLARVRAVERATEGLGKSQFVGVRLFLDGGDTVWLPMSDGQWATESAGALLERIEEARETRRNAPAGATAALLGRGDREARAWIRGLRAIGAGANADLRTAPVSPDQLWTVVESHGAASEERVAAAIALSPSLDAHGRERLGVTVDAIADERLRVAIDAAVKEDDAALEEALDEMSGAPREKRAAPSSSHD